MATDPQTRVAIVQAVLTFVIAVTSGFWAYYIYTADQNRAEARDREQRLRVEEQQARERRAAQQEAISQMSVQLGLMDAQCDFGVQLLLILDSPRPSRRAEGCYDAYIGAQSLLFLSRHRIKPKPSIPEDQWKNLWISLEKALIDAGDVSYDPKAIWRNWDAITKDANPSGSSI